MNPADELIERIVGASKIARGGRRHDIQRELRAHLEDFTHAARQDGRSPAEIEALIKAHFGDPEEIAREFAEVYRWERVILYASTFVLSTLAVTGMISVILFVAQIGIVLGLGISPPRVFAAQHLTQEGSYLLATATAYLGLLSLEQLFEGHRFRKALAALVAIVAATSAALAITIGHVPLLLLAAASGAVLRAVQLSCPRPFLRVAIVTSLFGAAAWAWTGLDVSRCGSPTAPRLVVGIAFGVSYYLMTQVSDRLGRTFLKGLSQA